jgi:predicted RNA binding protein YcfA (HicA-like mRNA interferase family)
MNSKFPLLSSAEIIGALKRRGFREVSQKGSHLKLTGNNHVVIVPQHRQVARGTLKSILAQADIKLDDFLRLLSN